MVLTPEEERQIRGILDKASERERRTATSSKKGFLSWLRSIALKYIVVKLVDLAWSTITTIFFGY